MSSKPNRRYFFRFRSPEGLEKRDMLSGHGFAAGFANTFAAEFANQHAAAQSNAVAAIHAHALSAVSTWTANQTVLTATLSDATTGAAANVTYKTYSSNGTTETEFKVSVTGAAADTTLDVAIDGTVVGQVTTDANGAGTLKLSSDPDSDETSLPANFPTTVAAGSAITVGTLSGTLATPTSAPGGCHGGGGAEDHTRLSAALTDTASTATGTARYSTGTHDGVTTTRLAVSVTGATASTTLDVAIDGTVVGQLTTDDTGAGKLVLSSNPKSTETALPANFPTTVTAGSTVTVGTLSGSLTTSEHGGGFAHFGRHR